MTQSQGKLVRVVLRHAVLQAIPRLQLAPLCTHTCTQSPTQTDRATNPPPLHSSTNVCSPAQTPQHDGHKC